MWWWSHRSYFWGGALVVVGGMLLLGNLGFLDNLDWNYVWPVGLIVVGAWVLLVRVHPRGAPTYEGHAPVELSEPRAGLERAMLDFNAEWAQLDVRGAALGDQLYRARIEHSHTPPEVQFDRATGTVRISPPDRQSVVGWGRFGVDVQLNDAVSWGVDIDSASVRGTLDLSTVKLTGLECDSGSSKIEIKVSKPAGEVPIRVAGSSVQVRLHRPADVPVGVTASGGSVRLTVDGVDQGQSGAQEWQSPGFQSTTDRFNANFSGVSVKIELERD